MTIGMIAKLTKGAYTLDLSSGRYSIFEFTPPSASEAVEIASGLSSNRTLGGIISSRRGTNFDFSLQVRILGASQAETDRAVNDIAAFLRRAGNEDEPVYLEWLPNNYVPYKPVWGQDGWRKIEIVYGNVYKSTIYALAQLRTKAQIVTLELNCKPYAMGLPQRLARATGGIFEDFIGSVDGTSKGLVIPEATTNKMTNPVFGPATWNTDWTDAANVTEIKNEDRQFILFGITSARLTSSSTSANNYYTQSIDAGNTNNHTFSAWVRKLDGSAVTATDVKIYYGGEKDSTYTSLGNGWYRVSATAAGIAAATATGIALKGLGTVLFLAGFQMEEKAYATPLCHGDMMGCAWTGTAHASTSTRTASTVNIYGVNQHYNSATIRAVIKTDCDNTCGTFTVGKAAYDAYYNSADDKFYWGSASTAAQTWAAGDVIVLHFTRGPNGETIYKNGASAGTSATAVPAIFEETIAVGWDTNEYLRGWWLDWTLWDRELTATEIANDYANILQIASDGQRVNTIPWLYGYEITTIGDLSAAGGIPGTIDAETFIDVNAGATNIGTTYINQSIGRIYSPVNAGAKNYVFRQCATAVSITAASVDFIDIDNPLVLSANYEQYAGEKAYILVDWSDAGENLYCAPMYRREKTATASYSVYTYVVGEYRPYSSGVQLIGPIRLPDYDPAFRNNVFDYSTEPGVQMAIACLRTTGSSTDDVTPDWYYAFVGRTAKITAPAVTFYSYRIHGREVHGYVIPDSIGGQLFLEGDLIEMTPNAINHLFVVYTDAVLPDIQEIIVIPRWLVT